MRLCGQRQGTLLFMAQQPHELEGSCQPPLLPSAQAGSVHHAEDLDLGNPTFYNWLRINLSDFYRGKRCYLSKRDIIFTPHSKQVFLGPRRRPCLPKPFVKPSWRRRPEQSCQHLCSRRPRGGRGPGRSPPHGDRLFWSSDRYFQSMLLAAFCGNCPQFFQLPILSFIPVT